MSLLQIRDLNVQFHDKEKGQEAVRQQSENRLHGRTLTRAGLSHDAHDLAGCGIEGQMPYRFLSFLFVMKLYVQIAYTQQTHLTTFLPLR